jgi:Skp family chaperone for outer membrane proteins
MRRAGLAAAVALTLFAAGAAAQDEARPLFLVLNQERILTGSARGQALLAEEEAGRERLRSEARDIEAAFEAEEQRLTEQRAELPAAEFRPLADDFDARVVAARRDQDARAAALAQEFDQKRRAFYADVGPILVGVMEEVGALAIFDETSVLISDQALNITDAVIAEIDRAAGGATGATGAPSEDAPDPGADAPAPEPDAAPPASGAD